MVTIEDRNSIYDVIIEEGSITNEWFKRFKIKYTDEELSAIGIEKRGSAYKLVRADGLYLYGEDVCECGDYYRAALIYQECYKMDSENVDVNRNLFFYCLSLGNPKSCIKYLMKFYENADELDKKTARFLLFLETHIMQIPFRKQVREFVLDDMLLPEEGEDKQNKLRKAAYRQDFSKALTYVEADQSPFSLSTVIYHLLITAKAHQIKLKKEMLQAIKNGRPSAAFTLLSNEMERHDLLPNQNLEMILLQDIIDSRKSLLYKQVSWKESASLGRLVKCRGYFLAYEHIINTGKVTQYEVLVPLLKMFIMENAKNRKRNNTASRSPLSYAHHLIEHSSFEEALEVIGEYLFEKNLEEFFYLIRMWMKIPYKDKAVMADELLELVENLKPGYLVDDSIYINLFKECVKREDFQQADLYLNILAKSKCRKHSMVSEDELVALKALLIRENIAPKSIAFKMNDIPQQD